MKPRHWLLIIIAGILVGMSAYFFVTRLGPGDPAPAFKLPDITGAEHSLEQHKGEVVLLHFWATWCRICTAETPIIQRIYDTYKGRGLVFLSILEDSPHGDEALQAFKQRMPITFPVLLDEYGEVAKAYDSYGVPETFIIGKDGIIIKRISGPLDDKEVNNLLEGIL